MRPLRLEVEGFACYRDRQPVLDLSGMSLFVIAGPTGSGKSTILDAMLYALFGMVPRVGRLGVAEFIAHGRDVLSVGFDFELHGKTYRVARSLRKGKRSASTAALAEWTPGGERSLADTVTDVDARIRDLVGLDFDAFTQTVILPQNQFARFLQSRPKDQRAILQHLLRHAVFERMRAEASRRRDAVERDLQIRTEQLQPLREATDGALEARLAACVQARTAREAAQADRDAAMAQAHELGVRRQRTVDLEACRAAAAVLDGRAAQVHAFEEELIAARRATAVMPVIDALEQARARTQAAVRDAAVAAQALLDLQAASDRAVCDLRDAEEAAGEIEALRELIRRLDEIRGDVERLPELAGALVTAREGVERAARRLDIARASAAACRAAHVKAGQQVVVARQAVDALPYDPERHARLDDLRDVAGRARSLGHDIEALARSVAQKRHQLETAIKTAEMRAQAREASQTQVNQARQDREGAEEARRAGRERHAAADLRRHLAPGDRCPVCEQVVATVPPRADVPELAALDAAVTRAVEKEQAGLEHHQRTGQELAAAQATVEQLVEAVRHLEQESESRQSERRECFDRLSAVIASATSAATSDPLAEFHDQLEQVKGTSAELRARRDTLGHAEKLASAAALALERAEAALRESEHVALQEERELARLAGDETAIRARIATVTSASDPSAERAAAAARITGLDQRVAATRAESARLLRDVAAAQARLDSLQQAHTVAQQDVDRHQAEVDRALATQGLASIAAARAASRPTLRIEALERETRAFQDARASNTARLAELRLEVEGREVDAATLDAAERWAAAADATLHAAVAVESRLQAEVEALRADVDRARRLTAEAEILRARLAVASEMAMDLRTDGFQDYLLEEAFRGLVAGASVRLQQMSRRYTMEWRDGEFHVVDHDNAGERRRAETLSGGETFMASLCLALQLSDEVLHASGALRMDSLFIDEGFGTLDVQSLAEVTDALETLRQDGARMIGVISHRPELTERLPGCIRIEKGVGESTWVVDRVG